MKTILFDLDGTLLPMNLDKFMQLYIGALTEKFRPYLAPELFKQKLWDGTKSMIMNTGRIKTNESIFMEVFMNGLPMDKKQAVALFEDFYDYEFQVAKQSTWQDQT